MEHADISDDEEQVINFIEISTARMGETSIKYATDPSTILGNGLTAIVYPGYHFGINKPAAVKFIKRQYLRVENDQVNELKIWSEIDQNINIVRLYDSCRDPKGGLFLAMEKAERTFWKQIKKCKPNRDDVIVWLHQVSQAVEYIHGKGVIHRDIKPDNILMFQQDRSSMVAKLADFGVSKMISSLERTGTFSNANGTLLWMAPEALENKSKKFKNTKMLDIFALGMTFFFGLSKGEHPFAISENDNNVPRSFVSKMTLDVVDLNKLSSDQKAANDLLYRMMKRRPEDRPNISEVLNHCLFWNWEKEQLFLLRTAISLSKHDCPDVTWIKDRIDKVYSDYFYNTQSRKRFNWIISGHESGLNISQILNTNGKRKHFRREYGNGDSVTKFLKLFRDKFVHHTELNEEGVLEFSDSDGIFCEERYVKILTSLCPSLCAVLYSVLIWNISIISLMPLSKIYFPRQLAVITSEMDVSTESTKISAVPSKTLFDPGLLPKFERFFAEYMEPKL